jgi:hypothetical protein
MFSPVMICSVLWNFMDANILYRRLSLVTWEARPRPTSMLRLSASACKGLAVEMYYSLKCPTFSP